MSDLAIPTLRLSKVRLKRFKAAWDSSIDLHPFNAMIGRNGAGKSSVFEALQWIDTSIRKNPSEATRRHRRIEHLVNVRCPAGKREFSIELIWTDPEEPSFECRYALTIGEDEATNHPSIKKEELAFNLNDKVYNILTTASGIRRFRFNKSKIFDFPLKQTLGLGLLLGGKLFDDDQISDYYTSLQLFWERAVFLRLSPNAMAERCPTENHAPTDPILDESGRNLPRLLESMSTDQIKGLVGAIRNSLPDYRELKTTRSDEEVYYSLAESMPSPGRKGRRHTPIPAWMLSEGTRRITAILALLQHAPPPSFLAVEEVENGLDPWTVVNVLNELRSAADMGTQVIVTTHSPWLLDNIPYDDIIKVHRVEGQTEYLRFTDSDAVKEYGRRIPPGALFVNEG